MRADRGLGRRYALLWRLLPRSFRRSFGAEMRRDAEETLEAAPPGGRSAVRRGLLVDLARTVAREWVDELRVAGAASRGGVGMTGWDVRRALRGLVRTPGFTAAVVLTLGLGIGANTVAFGLIDAWVLRTLPYQEPDRLVAIVPQQLFSRSLIRSAQEELDALEEAAGFGGTRLTLQGAGDPVAVFTAVVTDNAFRMLGVSPLIGRDFSPDDALPGAEPVTILAHDLWRSRFGADPGIVGRLIDLGGDGEPRRRVIGVMPEDHLPISDTGVGAWVPVVMDPADAQWTSSSFMTGIGRLRPGVELDAYQARLTSWLEGYVESNPGWFSAEEIAEARGVRWSDYLTRDVRQPLWITLGAALLVLLVACANVANLVLARTMGRHREFSVRAALGAGRVRAGAAILLETALLAAAGAATGIGLGALLAGWVEASLPDVLPEGGIPILGPALLWAIGVSAAATFLAGIVPAWHAGGRDPSEALGGARAQGDSAAMGRIQALLASAQLGLATVGVVSALVLGRSLQELASVDPGFDAGETLTFRITAPAGDYPEDADVARFYREAGEAIAAIPGVEAAGFLSRLPMIGGRSRVTIFPEGLQPVEGEPLPEATHRLLTTGGLEAMGVRLLRGRLLEEADSRGDEDGPRAVVVNSAMVERYWPSEDPIGKRFFGRGGRVDYTVVGVVEDLREDGLDRAVDPALYIPHADWPWRSMTGLVRPVAGTSATMSSVREAVWTVSPGVPIGGTRSLTEVVALALRPTRLLVVLAGVAGGITLLLGALGVYGVVAYGVNRRVREIGIRSALGAGSGRILRAEFQRAVRILAVGAAIGVGGAWATSRGLATLLYEVEPFDPVAVAGALTVLVATGLAAAWLPARRATRVDPVTALRSD